MRTVNLVDNYIYIYQLDKYLILPTYPETINDSLGSTFMSTNPLSRTAPIQSYAYSGPRTVQVSFELHRDLVSQLNYNNLGFIDSIMNDLQSDDYVDTLIKYLQAMALPSFKAASDAYDVITKMVNPPMVAVRWGNTVFIKGIVSGNVGVSWSGPIDSNGKYMTANINFSIIEVDPQDADSIAKWGSMRGLSTVLANSLKK